MISAIVTMEKIFTTTMSKEDRLNDEWSRFWAIHDELVAWEARMASERQVFMDQLKECAEHIEQINKEPETLW